MDRMIELPAMRRSAELAPYTADADSRTVEVVWSAGARVRRATFFGEPYDEELSLDPAHVRLDRLNAGAPFLKVHELDTLDAVIGSVVPGSARIENGRGIALVRISERADVEPIWRDIQAGHIRAVSIGYQVHRFEVSTAIAIQAEEADSEARHLGQRSMQHVSIAIFMEPRADI